jgi:thioredoxin reductase (NADPH)
MMRRNNMRKQSSLHSIRFFQSVMLVLFFSSYLCAEVTKEVSFDISNITFDENTVPVVILGGGIAGLMAAVYFSQADIPCIIIEGPTPGGALSLSQSVRNWPGIIEAPGQKIVEDLQKQVASGNVPTLKKQVVSVDLKQWPRVIEVQDLQDLSQKTTIRALAVIIAMGKEPTVLGVPGERGPDGYWGKGVGNCSVCEGSLYKNKTVAVVGGSDDAITNVRYLTDIVQKVYLLVHKDEFQTKNTEARDALLAHPRVEVLFNTDVKRINGDTTHVTNLDIYNNKTGEQRLLPIDGLLLSIGSNPNTTLLKQLVLDEKGFILLTDGQETTIQGVYAAGVIVASEHKGGQAISAASDGSKAALQAINFLKKIGFHTRKHSSKVLQSFIENYAW